SVQVPITTEGTNTITFSAVDQNGNQEAPKTLDVKFDKTVPTSTATVTPPLDPTGRATGPVSIALASTDATSGVPPAESSLDNGLTWLTYSAPFTISAPGSHTVRYRAVDVADNVGTVQSLAIIVGASAPVLDSIDPVVATAGGGALSLVVSGQNF